MRYECPSLRAPLGVRLRAGGGCSPARMSSPTALMCKRRSCAALGRSLPRTAAAAPPLTGRWGTWSAQRFNFLPARAVCSRRIAFFPELRAKSITSKKMIRGKTFWLRIFLNTIVERLLFLAYGRLRFCLEKLAKKLNLNGFSPTVFGLLVWRHERPQPKIT